MIQKGYYLSIFLVASVLCIAGEPAAPGGTSRVLHIDCGFYSPSNPPWRAAHDEAIVEEGYGYAVRGRSFRGGGGHCWFFDRGGFTITCPRGVAGRLYLHFIDLSNNSRRQSVTVCGEYREIIEDFLEPAGKWRVYEIKPAHTADGRMTVELACLAGANAVVSRIDFVPKGVPDALIPEVVPDYDDPKWQIENDWRRQERTRRLRVGSRAAVAGVLARGDLLLKDLRQQGARDAAEAAGLKLAECRRLFDALCRREDGGAKIAPGWAQLYRKARYAVRDAAFANPCLDFDELLFVKRYTPAIGHQCSHHVGSAQRPGGDLCILRGLRPDGEVRSVIKDRLPVGAIGRPDLSFDGRRVLFPYAAPRPKPTPYPYGKPGLVGGACLDYQVYEVGIDGDDLRQLTHGPAENTEPCYLPGGRICFTSSRCSKFVQCGDWAIVFSLCSMASDGSDVRPMTLAKEGEWFPSVLDDGRILYMRWEYVMKPFNTIQYLWTVYPDGNRAMLAYGDHFAFSPGPLSFIEARQVPDTTWVMATGAAHHNSGAGPIVMVDLDSPRATPGSLVRVTPEVRYPETAEMRGRGPSAGGWYNSPYPLSEKHYLACYSFEPNDGAPAGYGIYLMDIHGNKELIYRDRTHSAYSPMPVRPRPEPGVPAGMPRTGGKKRTGTLVMLDVYEGLEGVPRGKVKHLRILETIAKREHSIPQRLDVGIGSGWEPRRILGTVPVAEDGSAAFEVPADTSLFFEALDENYMDIRRMRSFTSVRPGETASCIGCHEDYDAAPMNKRPMALAGPPAKITPPPWGDVPMSFRDVVQPVLDRKCIACHDGAAGKSGGKKSGKAGHKSFDLTARHLVPAKGADNQSPGPPWPNTPHLVTASFVNLIKHVNFTKLSGYGGGNLPLAPYAVGSHRSALIKLLDGGHYKVKLTGDERRALVAWIDCNAPYLGSWDEYVARAEPESGL